MRLIDADMFEAYGTVIPEEYREQGKDAFLAGATEVLEQIDNAQTVDQGSLPIVQQLRGRNKRLKTVVKVQLERLRDKTAHIDDLSERIENIEKELDRQYDTVKRLRDALSRVVAERDAAIEDLHKPVPAWKWDGRVHRKEE